MLKLKWLGLLAAFCGLNACAGLPPVSKAPTHRIAVAAGPEDMVLDTGTETPRLLISCADRRAGRGGWGGILALDLATERVDTLERVGEPNDLAFFPHGIHLQWVNGGPKLYVIQHTQEAEGEESHAILRYRVGPTSLIYEMTYESPHFRSPNAVVARADGGFYVSNDSYKRGSLMEKVLKRKVSQLVHCTAEGNCRVVEERVAYGNGALIQGDFLYQAASRGNAIYRYRITANGDLQEKTKLGKLKGPDNLRAFGEDLLVACHPRPLAFLRHAKNAGQHSPSLICRISPAFGDPGLVQASVRPIFYDDGERISAAATAIIFGENLYISQVFAPYIVRTKAATD
ncbi:MAG: hypothetical protein AAGN35_27400 [Bacteroidota bacterium]